MGAERSYSLLKSGLCTEASLMRADLQQWAVELKEAPGHRHRKVWEWCFIAQALHERGMLTPGRRGLGFAVGQEPLTALFAKRGAQILATDLFAHDAAAKGWIETGQHADGYASINKRGICEEAALRERVRFRFADMNAIEPELHGEYDFVWSSCAFEHLGSLRHGMDFVLNAMDCIRNGGVAVHTTEFNVSSNDATVADGETVLYRRRDMDALVERLRRAGHDIDVDFDAGSGVADGTIDVPPYTHQTHLKLQIGKYVATSIGLIITKGPRRKWWRRFGC